MHNHLVEPGVEGRKVTSQGERLGGERSTLVQHAEHTVGARMAELVALQLVHPIGAKFVVGGSRFSPHNVECKKDEG
jgi:hypothetical protein